jgi:hypothetical protein
LVTVPYQSSCEPCISSDDSLEISYSSSSKTCTNSDGSPQIPYQTSAELPTISDDSPQNPYQSSAELPTISDDSPQNPYQSSDVSATSSDDSPQNPYQSSGETPTSSDRSSQNPYPSSGESGTSWDGSSQTLYQSSDACQLSWIFSLVFLLFYVESATYACYSCQIVLPTFFASDQSTLIPRFPQCYYYHYFDENANFAIYLELWSPHIFWFDQSLYQFWEHLHFVSFLRPAVPGAKIFKFTVYRLKMNKLLNGQNLLNRSGTRDVHNHICTHRHTCTSRFAGGIPRTNFLILGGSRHVETSKFWGRLFTMAVLYDNYYVCEKIKLIFL